VQADQEELRPGDSGTFRSDEETHMRDGKRFPEKYGGWQLARYRELMGEEAAARQRQLGRLTTRYRPPVRRRR
jgi:hypothetical protein